MPKRRKSKDNPYILNYNNENKVYIIQFKDNKNVIQIIKVTEEVYKVFDKAELEDISQMHEYERHIEHSDLCESTLNRRAINKSVSVEDEVEQKIINDKLKEAINQLSDIQKRRIIMFYFEGLTQQEIADKEGTSLRAIQYTLNSAINKLKEILKNLKNWLRKMLYKWGNKWEG